MTDALKRSMSTPTPQSEPQPGKNQVENNAGGFTYALDKWGQFRRFLILGTDGGTYYVNERQHTLLNTDIVDQCVAEDGVRAVNEIVDVSTRGLAPKNNQAIYALAVAASADDQVVRNAANDALGSVCRIGTHLYLFAEYMKLLERRGWGRGLRRAVARTLNGSTERLALHAVKYRQREGWTYQDLLRLSHAYEYADKEDGQDAQRRALFDFMCGRPEINVIAQYPELRVVNGYLLMQNAKDAAEATRLIKEYSLPWEAVPDEHRKSREVWDAMLPHMGVTALVRNLSQMARLGFLTPLGDIEKLIVSRLTDGDQIRKSREHPMRFLEAALVHESGGHSGLNRGATYTPNKNIVFALQSAFEYSFENVIPSGKRFYLGLDVSGSMASNVSGSHVMSCYEGSAAMALVTAETEPWTYAAGFTSSHGMFSRDVNLTEIPMDGRSTFASVLGKTRELGRQMGGTDCALPMLDALNKGMEVDMFVVYTDNETWAGDIHPDEALRRYRKETGIDAKLTVVGMTSTGFSIADPNDAGMMDVVGFDSSTPRALSLFASDEV